MFVANEGHRQKPLFSSIDMLPQAQKERLAKSWAGAFYTDVFSRIDERIFEVLYSEQVSRPNVPVNVLVSLEILREGHGWTDEQMYDHFTFDVQVRYAVGYHSLDQGHFALRTVYNFRQRLGKHMQETGENLFEECFEQLTDEQMAAYAVKGNIQRTDSKQIMSNIRERTRLQLLLEVLHRVNRVLSEADKARYAELLRPYVKVEAMKYTYRLKGESHRPHIAQVGVVMEQLVTQLADGYGETGQYAVLKRVFAEHFKIVRTGETTTIEPKSGEELGSDTLQSPDDLDATYRTKKKVGYKGYVVNVTETVDDEGGLNLITKVQTAPNVTEDATLLNEALPDLVERTDLDTMYSDGAYGSPEVDKTCGTHEVELHQTAIRGRAPNPDTVPLSDFTITADDVGTPHTATCPHGHTVSIEAGRQAGRFILRVPHTTCSDCAQHDCKRATKPPDAPERLCLVLYFSTAQLVLARRRQRTKALADRGRNPRAAVESTIYQLCCRFKNGKVKVRGLHRVAMTMLAAAAMVNVRRIWQSQTKKAVENSLNTIFCYFSRLIAFVDGLVRPFDVEQKSWVVREGGRV